MKKGMRITYGRKKNCIKGQLIDIHETYVIARDFLLIFVLTDNFTWQLTEASKVADGF
jgi:hypothetical protein